LDRTTESLARYATELAYANLTPAAVHAAKRSLIDALGCAIGGYDSEPCQIARRMAAMRTGTPAARVLGTDDLTTPEMAAFTNAVMVRYLDANDMYISPINGSGHPSDMLPGLMAVADAYQATGQELLTGMVVSYEMFAALARAVPLRARGWDQGLYVVLGVAAGASRLLKLSMEQTANAIAIAVSANVPTRQNRAGELAMWKGCATPSSTSSGVFAALLAREGVTGPTAAFEGKHGVWEQVTGPFELHPMGGQEGSEFALEQVHLKYFPSEFHSQAPLWIALRLRERVPIEQIAEINMRTYHMAYSEIGSEPAKWDPQTRETADHSLPYILAVALREGTITTASFDLDRVLDPTLRPLMNKIRVSESEELTRQFPEKLPSEIELVTTGGERIIERASYPKGHARNPMTDEEVEAKFRTFAEPIYGPKRCQAALAALWRLEEAKELGPVLDHFTIAPA
jgi:2-methylcitrate dehydratase